MELASKLGVPKGLQAFQRLIFGSISSGSFNRPSKGFVWRRTDSEGFPFFKPFLKWIGCS